MHELTLCHQLIKDISHYAKINQLSKVTSVNLKIGALSGVDIGAIEYSFPIAARNSIAEAAKLHIDVEKAYAFCITCQHDFTLESLFSPCNTCGDYQYEIKQGKIMQLKSMEGH